MESKAETYWKKMNEKARANGRLSDDWHIGELQATRNGTLVIMYQCPTTCRGPRKGEPNYRKATAKEKVILSMEDSKAIRLEVFGEE